MSLNEKPFTPGWKDVMRRARNEAGYLNGCIGPEHLLLAIIRKGEGLAVQVLLNLDVDLDKLKGAVDERIPHGGQPAAATAPLSPEALRVVEVSHEFASEFGHNWIGTEHMLLALVKEEATPAGQALKSLCVKIEEAKREAMALIEGCR